MLLSGVVLPVFGNGSMSRDYTFVDDIICGIQAAMAYGDSQYEVINLGSMHSVSLLEMVTTLAEAIGVEPPIEFMPEQPGDVSQTFASIQKAKRLLGYEPSTQFRKGIDCFVSWLVSRTEVRPTTWATQSGSVHDNDVRISNYGTT
jgi:UDP-glucuronate 4-epimerase